MKEMKIKSKLLLLGLLPALVMMSAAIGIIITLENKAIDEEVGLYQENLVQERKNQLKDTVNIAKHAVEHVLANTPNTTVALDELRQLLTPLRFAENNAGYFFIYDHQGVTLVHPLTPEKHGQGMIGLKDSNGVAIIRELIQASQKGGGFVAYNYPKTSGGQPQPKLSFATSVNNGQWMIGTGLYVDDIDREVAIYRDDAISSMQSRFQIVLTTTLVLGVLFAMAILYFANRMARPVQNMARTLNEIADGEGDLTRRLDIHGHDEIAQLGDAFNRFVAKLQGIITQVSDATHHVSGAAGNIHAQTVRLTEQLHEHNNETEQVVTAITEMSSAASEVAMNANEVSNATSSASEESHIAQQRVDTSVVSITALVEEVDQAAQHIHSLNQQSQKIDNVLKVIGDIAEQTNLLALNAAIEAARAGEQGRGFAVVADEVRGLASRTQSSTQEIKEMLDELHALVSQAVSSMTHSQSTCSEAVDAANSITESLSTVTGAVEAINVMTSQIATAATEQSSVTDEINRNMVAIQDIVAELTESSRSSEQVVSELNHAGADLKKLVGQFKTS
ncbi:methyl-accepting chemotaxis protein [Photobacterium atrarenae]|uniref:Methyl-accepting chemotaxis protein n=1 Tax=Photobacterium atrarenae TaxID=865757 RepID=A0ABY5GBI8_9GAMM|nr:methyl-accepting chemotaxis protein [Photobacterium atrarenae]UTV26555.1 methyl-accepting chemotaxis protein [Photobacterium atrarenae]